MVKRVYFHRRKSIPPKRKNISPYSSQSPVDSPQISRFSPPKSQISESKHSTLNIPRPEVASKPEVVSEPEAASKPEASKPEVKIEASSKPSFKLHQPKAFGKNSVLEKKISQLHHQKQTSDAINQSAKTISEQKSAKNQAEEVKVAEYLANLGKNTANIMSDKSMKLSGTKKKSDKSTGIKPTGKLKLGSPGKIEKMKKLRRSPRKSNSSSFAQTFGLSVISNTKLPGRIPKKKKN